jgi:hypothetical protein
MLLVIVNQDYPLKHMLLYHGIFVLYLWSRKDGLHPEVESKSVNRCNHKGSKVYTQWNMGKRTDALQVPVLAFVSQQ